MYVKVDLQVPVLMQLPNQEQTRLRLPPTLFSEMKE
jgi:hypothetical protein